MCELQRSARRAGQGAGTAPDAEQLADIAFGAFLAAMVARGVNGNVWTPHMPNIDIHLKACTAAGRRDAWSRLGRMLARKERRDRR